MLFGESKTTTIAHVLRPSDLPIVKRRLSLLFQDIVGIGQFLLVEHGNFLGAVKMVSMAFLYPECLFNQQSFEPNKYK
jgi:hypothetical protein